MTPEQRLARVAAWAASTPGVSAALVVGSRARTDVPADEHSDADVVLVCDDPDRWLRATDWLAEFGRPLLTFVEETAVGGQLERRVLYDDGGDVDFSIITPAAADAIVATPEGASVIARGIRVLHDERSRFEPGSSRPQGAAPLPSAEEVEELAHDFWYHVLWVARKLARGELWVALQGLNGHLAGMLRVAVEWDAIVHGQRDVWHRGRFLERWARLEVVNRLRGTMADYEPAAARDALMAAADLFAHIARPVADRVAASYPEEGERRVRELTLEILGSDR
jgi:aminoglycoside 6-adenylyltransferase